MFGVTIDSINNLADIVTSLKNLSYKPTARIVFDENMSATYYKIAAKQIHEVSYVMGELLDSFYFKNLNQEAYSKRVTEYLTVLQDDVDIWEIGNEINGEWLGDTTSVVSKINSAYALVKAKGKQSSLTLYYNENCWADASNEVFAWTQNNISVSMRLGLDYVFLSYYEDDCNNLQPNWPLVFAKLATLFPNSKIGFGEIGTKKSDKKASYINRYYNMEINHPNFVGGYFWWYFVQDMVPMNKPLWHTLNEAIR